MESSKLIYCVSIVSKTITEKLNNQTFDQVAYLLSNLDKFEEPVFMIRLQDDINKGG